MEYNGACSRSVPGNGVYRMQPYIHTRVVWAALLPAIFVVVPTLYGPARRALGTGKESFRDCCFRAPFVVRDVLHSFGSDMEQFVFS